jgi:hypothetical protein
MKNKTFLVLIVLTVAAVVVAALARRSPHASSVDPAATGVLFPGLVDHINDVAQIHVEKGGKSATIRREGSEWKLTDRGGYPAKFDQAKKTAVRVAQLEIEEVKTSKKENHARLGLQWPPPPAPEGEAAADSDAADAALVTLQDASGKELASLVVGKSEWRGSSQHLYVRRANEDQVYLVKGQLETTPDPQTWLDDKIVEVENDRVQDVTITHTDGEEVKIARSPTNHTQFHVENVPPGQSERFEGVANGVAQALGYGLKLEDVRPASEVDFTKEPVAHTRFRCVDGLELMVETCKLDDKTWIKVSANYVAPPETAPAEASTPAEGEAPAADQPASDAPSSPEGEAAKTEEGAETPKKDVAKEAADLNARLAPWAFAVGSYKTDVLARRMKDLLAEPKAEEAVPGDDLGNPGEEVVEPDPGMDDEGSETPAPPDDGAEKPEEPHDGG